MSVPSQLGMFSFFNAPRPNARSPLFDADPMEIHNSMVRTSRPIYDNINHDGLAGKPNLSSEFDNQLTFSESNIDTFRMPYQICY